MLSSTAADPALSGVCFIVVELQLSYLLTPFIDLKHFLISCKMMPRISSSLTKKFYSYVDEVCTALHTIVQQRTPELCIFCFWRLPMESISMNSFLLGFPNWPLMSAKMLYIYLTLGVTKNIFSCELYEGLYLLCILCLSMQVI